MPLSYSFIFVANPNHNCLKRIFQIFTFLIFFTLLIFSGKDVSAQYNYKVYNYYCVGLKFGYDYNIVDLDPERFVSAVPRFNFHIGASGAWYYKYFMEFHADIRYSNKSIILDWQYPEDLTSLIPDYSLYRLHYISIPLQTRFNIIYQKYFKLNAGVGFNPEFRVRQREYTTFQTGATREAYKDFLTDDYRRVIIGAPLSIHAKYNYERNWAVEFSLTYSLYLNRANKIYWRVPGSDVIIDFAYFYEF